MAAEIKAKLTLDRTAFESGLNKAVKSAGKAGIAAGIALGAGMIKAVQVASDLNETLSKTQAIFGGSTSGVEAWASGAAKAFGQSKRQALDAASTFGVFGKAAGLSGDELAGFSMRLTELSSDFASFQNTSPEEAITAIGAALRGENEPIQKYGILLNDAALKNEALKMGLISTTKDALTPQQRVLAAYNSILAQSTVQQGDFARTADGLANSTRTFQSSLEDLTAKAGQEFLPIAKEMVAAGNEFLAYLQEKNAIQNFVSTLQLIPATMAEVIASFYEAKAALNETLYAPARGMKAGYLRDVAELEKALAKAEARGGIMGAADAALIKTQIAAKKGLAGGLLSDDTEKENADLRAKAGMWRQTQQSILNDLASKQGGISLGGPSSGTGAAPFTLPGGSAAGTASGGSAADRFDSDFQSGEGVFAPGYFGLDTTAPAGGFGIGTGQGPLSALSQIEGGRLGAGASPIRSMPGTFDNFRTATRVGALGGGSTVSALGGANTKGASTGGAYGVIRRGDAARKKAEIAAAQKAEADKKAGKGGDPVDSILTILQKTFVQK